MLTPCEIEDALTCLVLSEGVYKAAEGPPSSATLALNQLLLELQTSLPTPNALPQLEAVQFSRRAAPHRYLLARSRGGSTQLEGPGAALYIAFMGTKQPRDLLADANMLTALLWSAEAAAAAAEAAGEPADVAQQAGHVGGNAARTVLAVTGAAAGAAAAPPAAAAAGDAAPPGVGARSVPRAAPAAHRGFLARSQSIPAEPLFAHARRQGLRLVLCGHSMGGAVAQLCMLRLLRALPSPPPPDQLRCIVFGAPAIGNAALAQHVQQQGWAAHFLSVALPEDPIPRLLLQTLPSQKLAPQPWAAAAVAVANEELHSQGVDRTPQDGRVEEQDASTLQPAALPATQQDRNTSRGPSAPVDSQLQGATLGGAAGAAGPWISGAAASALRAAGAAGTARALAAAQRQLAVAGGVAARTARAGASVLPRPPPLLPTFAHIGRVARLLPYALVPAGGMHAVQLPAATDVAGLAEAQQPGVVQQWRGLHSMQHYRARAAALCGPVLQKQQQPNNHTASDVQVALSRSLAPAIAVSQAVARLPVLPLLPALDQAQQAQRQVVQLSVEVHGTGLEFCTGAWLRLPGMAGPVQAAEVTNLARQRVLDRLQASTNHAWQRNENGGSKPGSWLLTAAERGWARVCRMGQQQQPRELADSVAESSPGLMLRFSVPATALLGLQLKSEQWQSHGQAGRESADAAALLPEASLALHSDFDRAAGAAKLLPRVVWLLGLDVPLAAATWEQLQAVASGCQAQQAQKQRWRLPSVAGAPLPGWMRGGRLRVAGQAQQSAATAEGVEHNDATAPAQPQHQPQQQLQDQELAGSSHIRQRLHRLREQLAAHLPTNNADGESTALPAALLRCMLLLDASHVFAEGRLSDSSVNARVGSSSSSLEQQLELAIDVLRGLAAQQQSRQHAPLVDGGWAVWVRRQAAAAAEDGEQPELEDVDDEYLAELRELGVAASIRRTVTRAVHAAAAQRRAMMRRWRQVAAPLRAAPHPDAILLLVHHQQLLSSRYGEGLDSSSLGAVRQLAAACRACCRDSSAAGAAGAAGSGTGGGAAISMGVPFLLAVASEGPLSAPYQHELAAAAGLLERSAGGSMGSITIGSEHGCVVPMLLRQQQAGQLGSRQSSGSRQAGQGQATLPASTGGCKSVPQVEPLLAAMLAHARMVGNGQHGLGLYARL